MCAEWLWRQRNRNRQHKGMDDTIKQPTTKAEKLNVLCTNTSTHIYICTHIYYIYNTYISGKSKESLPVTLCICKQDDLSNGAAARVSIWGKGEPQDGSRGVTASERNGKWRQAEIKIHTNCRSAKLNEFYLYELRKTCAPTAATPIATAPGSHVYTHTHTNTAIISVHSHVRGC